MKVTVLLRSLDRGGSERQAALTAVELSRRGHHVEVVVFHDAAAFRELVTSAGLAPVVLGGPRPLLPVALWLHLRRSRPDVLLSYMPGANVVSLAARATRNRAVIVWGVRSDSTGVRGSGRLDRLTVRFEPLVSRWADAAVANSAKGRDDAIARGVGPQRFAVVPNGIDTDHWTPGSADEARDALGLPRDATLIGRVGRLHPLKDLPTLIDAVAGLRRGERDVELVVAGGGDDGLRFAATAQAKRVGVGVHWLGARDDLVALYRAVDVVVSNSVGEGFPNVVAEALACGVACIGTDVGATAEIIDDRRWVVAPRDTPGLTAALDHLLSLDAAERAAVGTRGRARIVGEYRVALLGERLEALFDELVAESVARPSRGVRR